MRIVTMVSFQVLLEGDKILTNPKAGAKKDLWGGGVIKGKSS